LVRDAFGGKQMQPEQISDFAFSVESSPAPHTWKSLLCIAAIVLVVVWAAWDDWKQRQL